MLTNPIVKKIPLEPQERVEAVTEAIPSALNALGLRHNFDFVLEEYDEVTIAGTSDYLLTGKNAVQDILDVINVRYGDDRLLLEQLRAPFADRLMSGRGDSTFEVTSWVPAGRTSMNPTIRLIGTPATSGITIRIRYRKRKLAIELWPEELLFVVESAVIARLDPAYIPVFESDLAIAIARFDAQTPDRDAVRLDEETLSDNIRRNTLFGYQ